MKYLLTGGSGYLGAYIKKSIHGNFISLGKSTANDIQTDLAIQIPNIPPVEQVIHCAGLAHRIPKTKQEEDQFWNVNLTGTKNLTAAIDKLDVKPKSFVFISSVAVYGLDQGDLIKETTSLHPNTPYGISKKEAEDFLIKWAESNKINLTVLRLPLIAGGVNTPGNLGAMITAIKRNYYFRVGQGKAKKSMVLAEDVAELIPHLTYKQGVFNLTDGHHPRMAELDTYLCGILQKKVHKLGVGILRPLAKLGDVLPFFPLNSYRLEKLNQSLTFDDTLAREVLGWNPRPVIGNLDLKH